jgi:hypothetical protein
MEDLCVFCEDPGSFPAQHALIHGVKTELKLIVTL